MRMRWWCLAFCVFYITSYHVLLQGGWTALILASRKGYFKVVGHLVDNGADVSLSNWVSETTYYRL